MPQFERPTDLPGALRTAREIMDPRTDFEIYLEVARRVVWLDLEDTLAALPLSDVRKREIINAETYAVAQPAHLHDASTYTPTNMVELLDRLGVLAPEKPLIFLHELAEETLEALALYEGDRRAQEWGVINAKAAALLRNRAAAADGNKASLDRVNDESRWTLFQPEGWAEFLAGLEQTSEA